MEKIFFAKMLDFIHEMMTISQKSQEKIFFKITCDSKLAGK